MRPREEILNEAKTLLMGMSSPHALLILEALLDVRDLLQTANLRLNRLRAE